MKGNPYRATDRLDAVGWSAKRLRIVSSVSGRAEVCRRQLRKPGKYGGQPLIYRKHGRRKLRNGLSLRLVLRGLPEWGQEVAGVRHPPSTNGPCPHQESLVRRGPATTLGEDEAVPVLRGRPNPRQMSRESALDDGRSAARMNRKSGWQLVGSCCQPDPHSTATREQGSQGRESPQPQAA